MAIVVKDPLLKPLNPLPLTAQTSLFKYRLVRGITDGRFRGVRRGSCTILHP